jgi:hypothetical protein
MLAVRAVYLDAIERTAAASPPVTASIREPG